MALFPRVCHTALIVSFSARSNAMYSNAQYEPPGHSLPHQSKFEVGRSQLRIWAGSPKEICGIICHYTRHVTQLRTSLSNASFDLQDLRKSKDIVKTHKKTDKQIAGAVLQQDNRTQTNSGGCVTTGQQMQSKHPCIDWHSERARSVRPLRYLHRYVRASKLIIYWHRAACAARYDEYVSVPHLGT
jgi:hypothetical protein